MSSYSDMLLGARQVLDGNWREGRTAGGLAFGYTCPDAEKYPGVVLTSVRRWRDGPRFGSALLHRYNALTNQYEMPNPNGNSVSARS